MTLEEFLSDGPRFLRYDGGTVELRLADPTETGDADVHLVRSLATGNLIAVRIVATEASSFGSGVYLGM